MIKALAVKFQCTKRYFSMLKVGYVMIEICRPKTNFFLELATGKLLLGFNNGLEQQGYSLI